LAASLLELQLQRLKKLVALDKLQLRTRTLGLHGRELSLPLLEHELELTPSLFALSCFVLAASLLELQLQRLKKLVALDKLQLRTRSFGSMLLERGLELLCVRFAGLREFELECLEVGSCRRELRPVLVSSGELDPNAFKLLCTLVECRAKGRDRTVRLSGFARDPKRTNIRIAGRRRGGVGFQGLQRNPNTLSRPECKTIFRSERPTMLFRESVSDRRAYRKAKADQDLPKRRATRLLLG
jgi:hypothetical protein